MTLHTHHIKNIANVTFDCHSLTRMIFCFLRAGGGVWRYHCQTHLLCSLNMKKRRVRTLQSVANKDHKQQLISCLCHRCVHFSTSDSEAEREAFVRPEAVRGEADLDIMRVGEEGRRGRSVATERPQSYRRSLNLKNKTWKCYQSTFPDLCPWTAHPYEFKSLVAQFMKWRDTSHCFTVFFKKKEELW